VRAVHDELFDIVKTDREAGVGTAVQAKTTTGPKSPSTTSPATPCCEDRGEPVPSKHAAKFIRRPAFPLRRLASHTRWGDDGPMSSTPAIPSHERARARQRSEVADRCKIAADVRAFASMTGQAWAVNGGRKL
jgi:hypothetical protein